MAQFLAEKAAKSPLAFRNRGGEITRLEALSDGTFAFAITLLVVSLEVPATFTELLGAMRGFLAFAICFTMIVWIWFQHTRFFRRYGLEDAATVALNGVLLFVVLFYVYPLKFLWTLLVNGFTGGMRELKPGAEPPLYAAQAPQLMTIYALGFLAIFWSLALLYVRAYAKRKALHLNDLEVFDTKAGIYENFGVGSVGLLSIAIVTIGGPRYSAWAGMCYALIGVVKAGHGYWHGSTRARMEMEFLARAEAVTAPKAGAAAAAPSPGL